MPWQTPCLAGTLALALALLLPRPSGACGTLPTFQTMRVKGTPKMYYIPGEQVVYECRPGYRQGINSRDILITCGSNNVWDVPEETCVKKWCENPGDLLNGNIVTQEGNLEYGATVTYACNEGFHLIGAKTLRCVFSGYKLQWDQNPPICERGLCKPPPAIANGRYSNSGKDTFSYNEVVTYSCNPSSGQDEFSLVGESRLICSISGEWSSSPPECKVVKCPFPALRNGFIVSGMAKKFYYKAQVELTCSPGFNLSGASEIHCGANSTWEPAMPQCIHSSKPVPPTQSPVPTHPGTGAAVPPPWPPDSSDAGDFSDGTTSEGIGAGFITLIVLTILGAIIAVGLGLYWYLKSRKRKSDLTPEYSTYQDKSTIPTEESQ